MMSIFRLKLSEENTHCPSLKALSYPMRATRTNSLTSTSPFVNVVIIEIYFDEYIRGSNQLGDGS